MAVRAVSRTPADQARTLRFGRAVVRFADQWTGHQSMGCCGDVISLPNLPNLKISPLADGRQFLCSSGSLAEVGFGGEDEGGPFLRRIDPEALRILGACGERGFWDWLTPEAVASVRNRTGRYAHRYGGVYAIDTGLTWNQVGLILGCLGRINHPRAVISLPLYPPWAKFTGNLIKIDSSLDGTVYLAEGGISLPVPPQTAGRTVSLVKTIHLIARPLVYLDLAGE